MISGVLRKHLRKATKDLWQTEFLYTNVQNASQTSVDTNEKKCFNEMIMYVIRTFVKSCNTSSFIIFYLDNPT